MQRAGRLVELSSARRGPFRFILMGDSGMGPITNEEAHSIPCEPLLSDNWAAGDTSLSKTASLMKTLTILAMVAALTGAGYAQMSILPPSSSTDGVPVQSIGVNAGTTHWDSTSTLGAFKVDSSTEGTAPITTVAYNPIGLPFSTAIPTAIQTSLNTLNANGGVVRAIFLGESAGWRDSLGYTRSGNYAGPQSYTAFAQMETNPSSGNPVNIQYGDHFDVSLAVGAAANFDLWFQGDGGQAAAGGDYTLFHPANSSNFTGPGNAMWSQQSLNVNTWIPSRASYMDVPTYVVGLEDWRLDMGSDRDYSDAVIGLQFFSADGTPLAPATPEPKTYGLIGAASLLGLAALRRYMRGKNRLFIATQAAGI